MTTKFQISDKRGDAILVVVAEYESPEQAEAQFAAAVALAGLGAAYEAFGQQVAGIPSITQLTRPQQPAAALGDAPWGVPPVPAYQPPQLPAAAAPAGAPGQAPVCQHGQKLWREGTSAANGRPWKAWFCPAPGNDPTQCAKEWVR